MPGSAPYLSEKLYMRASKVGAAGISGSNAATTHRNFYMIKFLSLAAALVLVTPVALAAMAQAALIVA